MCCFCSPTWRQWRHMTMLYSLLLLFNSPGEVFLSGLILVSQSWVMEEWLLHWRSVVMSNLAHTPLSALWSTPKQVCCSIDLISFVIFSSISKSEKTWSAYHLHGIFGWDFGDKWNGLFLPLKMGQNTMLYHLSKTTQLSSVDWGD